MVSENENRCFIFSTYRKKNRWYGQSLWAFFFFFFKEKNVLFFQERKSDRGWRRKRTTWIVPICIRGTEKQRKRERFLMFFSWQKVN